MDGILEHIESSQEVGELFAALSAAQGDIPPLKAAREVKVKMRSGGAYSYSYVTLGKIKAKIAKPLADNGLFFTQPIINNTLLTIIGHKSGQWFVAARMEVPGNMANPQSYGSGLTYARRYSLTTALGICSADEDDDGVIANESRFNNDSNSDGQRIAKKLDEYRSKIDVIEDASGLNKAI